jgi:hypothetical protein
MGDFLYERRKIPVIIAICFLWRCSLAEQFFNGSFPLFEFIFLVLKEFGLCPYLPNQVIFSQCFSSYYALPLLLINFKRR